MVPAMPVIPQDTATANDPASLFKSLGAPKLRILRILGDSRGPLTRMKISDRYGTGNAYEFVGRHIGYFDPVKRAARERTKDGFGTPERPCPSLLTLGLITVDTFDIDGIKEIAISLTESGRRVLETCKDIPLPPPVNSKKEEE